MAPCSTSLSSMHLLKPSEKHNLRLRKPIVEKMRRDRINSCIDQLKLILEKEFQKQDPNAKLEKADILEMTVSFLKQQLQPRPQLSQRDYSQGYSQCWRESLNFLSLSSKTAVPAAASLHRLQQLPQAQRASSPQLHSTSPASPSPRTPSSQLRSTSPASPSPRTPSPQNNSAKGPVWRPW